MASGGIVATVHDIFVSSPLNALFYLLLVFVVYQLVTASANVVYNLFFHPLRDIPGPGLAAATELYKAFYLFKGSLIYQEKWLHETYGPMVRMAPNEVAFVHPQAWKDIYGHRTGGKPATKKPRFIDPAHEGHDMLEFIATEEEHGQRRRLYAHAFSDQAIKKQESMLQYHVNKLVLKLKNNAEHLPDQPQDIVSWLHFCTFDIMGDLAFGNDMGMLDDGKYNPWVKAIVSSMKDFAIVGLAKNYQPFKFLFHWTFVGSILKRAIDMHRAYAGERVDKRLARDVDRPDIWGLLLKADPDRMPSRWAMHEDGMLFMQAGTDTTSTLLCGLLYYLLLNPDKLATLKHEIRTELKGLDNLGLEELARLPYMAACIEEGLRIHPPAPPGFTRISPPGGIAVCGRFFPEGTYIAVPQYAAFHNEGNFSLPDEFHPERWTSPPDSRFANDRKDALQPFLYGPRNCIGKNLAYSEMRLILASIMLHFDLELAEESRDWMPHGAWGLWQKPPLFLFMKKAAV